MTNVLKLDIIVTQSQIQLQVCAVEKCKLLGRYCREKYLDIPIPFPQQFEKRVVDLWGK